MQMSNHHLIQIHQLKPHLTTVRQLKKSINYFINIKLIVFL